MYRSLILLLTIVAPATSIIFGSLECSDAFACNVPFVETDGFFVCYDDNVRCAPTQILDSASVLKINSDEECGWCGDLGNFNACSCTCDTLFGTDDGSEVKLSLFFGIIELDLCIGEDTAYSLSQGADPFLECYNLGSCQGL